MPPFAQTSVGARVAYWRKRRGGMTQTVLAGLAGVSQPYISRLESGLRDVERRSTLLALAEALQVSVADLVGTPGDSTDPARQRAERAISRIRVVLVEIEEGERRRPSRSVAELDRLLLQVSTLRTEARYADMAAHLPELLTEAAAHGRGWLARAGYETASTLKNLGYRDLALPAARVAVAGARDGDDTVWLGAAQYMHTVVLPLEAPGIATRVAEKALTNLQAHAAQPQARQMLMQLHQSAALTCAVGGHSDDAEAHLREAQREAETLGDPDDGIGFNLLCCGPTNVGLWHMTIAGELGEYQRVIELARRHNPAHLRVADRHFSYHLNLGRALAHTRRDAEATVALGRAERAAPVAFAVHPGARDTISAMVHRAHRRAVPAELRVLARRVGVTPAPAT